MLSSPRSSFKASNTVPSRRSVSALSRPIQKYTKLFKVHSVPPWAASFAWSMFLAFLSDHFRHRFIFIMISISASLCGFAMMLSPLNYTTKYGALFLITSGTYGAMPLIGKFAIFPLERRC